MTRRRRGGTAREHPDRSAIGSRAGESMEADSPAVVEGGLRRATELQLAWDASRRRGSSHSGSDQKGTYVTARAGSIATQWKRTGKWEGWRARNGARARGIVHGSTRGKRWRRHAEGGKGRHAREGARNEVCGRAHMGSFSDRERMARGKQRAVRSAWKHTRERKRGVRGKRRALRCARRRTARGKGWRAGSGAH